MLKNHAYDLTETRYGIFMKDTKACRRILTHLKQHFDEELEVKLASA